MEGDSLDAVLKAGNWTSESNYPYNTFYNRHIGEYSIAIEVLAGHNA